MFCSSSENEGNFNTDTVYPGNQSGEYPTAEFPLKHISKRPLTPMCLYCWHRVRSLLRVQVKFHLFCSSTLDQFEKRKQTHTHKKHTHNSCGFVAKSYFQCRLSAQHVKLSDRTGSACLRKVRGKYRYGEITEISPSPPTQTMLLPPYSKYCLTACSIGVKRFLVPVFNGDRREGILRVDFHLKRVFGSNLFW